MLDLLAAPLLQGVVIGAHLVSLHSEPTYTCDGALVRQCTYNNVNPGLYVRMPSGLTAGAYHNSYRQTAAYVGWTWESGYAAVTVGGAVGYRFAPVMPVVIPSLRVPLAGEWSARISLIPKPSLRPEVAVTHLSIERRW